MSRWRPRGQLETRNSKLRTVQLPSLRQGAQAFEFGGDLAAEAVQLADGCDDRAGEMVAQFAEFEGRAAEATELLGETLGGERLFLGDGERVRGLGLGDVALFIAADDRERRADVAVDLEGDGALKARGATFAGDALC